MFVNLERKNVNKKNFKDLEVLWRWQSPDDDLEGLTNFKPYVLRATPLVVDGVAYMSTGMSQVAAIEVDTGETLWVHDTEMRSDRLRSSYES